MWGYFGSQQPSPSYLGPLTVLRFASAFANLRWPLRHVGEEPCSQNSHHISLESTKHVCLTIKRVFRYLPSQSFYAISKEDTVIFVKTHWFGVTWHFHFHKSTQTKGNISTLYISSSWLTPLHKTMLFEASVIRLYRKGDSFEFFPVSSTHFGVLVHQ